MRTKQLEHLARLYLAIPIDVKHLERKVKFLADRCPSAQHAERLHKLGKRDDSRLRFCRKGDCRKSDCCGARARRFNGWGG